MSRKQIFFFLIPMLFIGLNGRAQELINDNFKSHSFRFIGPEGNRAIAIVGEPGNPMVNYIGAASGGLWKTEDGGIGWRPIFDGQDISSIGSIDLAPTDPKKVWVGTGETFLMRPAHAMGNGIYYSPDAGKTWQHKKCYHKNKSRPNTI